MNYEISLDMTPGGMPPVLHMAQYDTDRTYSVKLMNAGAVVSFDPDATATVKGYNGKNAFEIDATVIPISLGHTTTEIEFQLTAASTDQYGKIPVTIEIDNDGATISPLLLIFDIQPAGLTNEQAAASPEFQTAIEAAVATAMAHYEPLIVKITGSSMPYSIDKTYAEITNAVVANRPIWAEWNGYRLQFVGIDNGALFQYVDTSTTTTVLVEFFISTTGVTSKNPRNI